MMCDAERSSTKGPIAERSKCPKVTPQKKKKKNTNNVMDTEFS